MLRDLWIQAPNIVPRGGATIYIQTSLYVLVRIAGTKDRMGFIDAPEIGLKIIKEVHYPLFLACN